MIDAIRAELIKMRSMPGVWVTFALGFPLAVLIVLAVLANAGGFPGHTFYYVESLKQRRELLGAGYFACEVLAPILGVLCVTGEYRHKTMTTTFVLRPIRSQVLLAKVAVTALWSVLLALLTLVAVAAVGLPWNAALGGVTSQVTDQIGAVVPGLLVSAILLGLFGLGFGTLVKNQIAAILLTIGGTLILESILIALAHAIFHYDLNWLPNAAGAALAGDIARGFGGGGRGAGFHLLTWWQGGLVMLAWGLIPLTIGFFTTFRRDVT
ncbi:MAG TPA: ABC transporter permease [Acidimicrobiales bacterium]|nr:ABC transporter permease [Acidimicrobiales bacterium]